MGHERWVLSEQWHCLTARIDTGVLHHAGEIHVDEYLSSKEEAAGSRPVTRSNRPRAERSPGLRSTRDLGLVGLGGVTPSVLQ